MADDVDLQAIRRMLANPREETACSIAGVRVICASSKLKELIEKFEKMFAAPMPSEQPFRIAIFWDDEDERLTIGTAIAERAKEFGFSASLVRDNWGRWAQKAQNPGQSTSSMYILTASPPESKARQGFSSIASMILFWPLNAAGTALLPDRIEEIVLQSFAERPLDKAAHVIDAAFDILNSVDEINGDFSPRRLIDLVDASALLGVCVDPSKFVDVSAAREAGHRLAEGLRSQAALRPGVPLGAADLHRIMFPQQVPLSPNLRRLWVEGETDSALFQLAARLLRAEHPDGSHCDLLESIKIEILGGASLVEEAMRRCDRSPKSELFLLDADRDGILAEHQVKSSNFPTAVLDRNAVMSACDPEWVIEDLLSVACLDRFYSAHPHLKPAREEITHQEKIGRRLVVLGKDKGALVDWLEKNATIEDVWGIVQQLLIVRRYFGLRGPRFEYSLPLDGRTGMRPHPWWFIQ